MRGYHPLTDKYSQIAKMNGGKRAEEFEIKKDDDIEIYDLANWTFVERDPVIQEFDGFWQIYAPKEFTEELIQYLADAISDGALESGRVDTSYQRDTTVCLLHCLSTDRNMMKRVLRYMIDTNKVQKTKSGRLYNISYKFNAQSQASLTGDKFVALIKLEDYVDLHTGKFLDEK
mgnify:FL=1